MKEIVDFERRNKNSLMSAAERLQRHIETAFLEYVEFASPFEYSLFAAVLAQLASDTRTFPHMRTDVVDKILERLEKEEDVWDTNPFLLYARGEDGKFAPRRRVRRKTGISIQSTSRDIESRLVDLRLSQGTDDLDGALQETMPELILKIGQAFFATNNRAGTGDLFAELTRWLEIHTTADMTRGAVDTILLAHFALLHPGRIPKADLLARKLANARVSNSTEDVGLILDMALVGQDVTTVYQELEPQMKADFATGNITLQQSVQWLVLLYVTDQVNASRRKAAQAVESYNENKEEFEAPPRDSEAYGLNWSNIGKVVVKKSTMLANVDTGNGVFADTDFAPGDVITQYCGKYYPKELPIGYERRVHTPYLRVSRDPTAYVDGEKNLSKLNMKQVGQIIQDPITEKYYNSDNKQIMGLHVPPAYRDASCVTAQVPKDPGLRVHFFDIATKPIKKGEEIFTDYGYSPELYAKFKMVAKPA